MSVKTIEIEREKKFKGTIIIDSQGFLNFLWVIES